MTSKDLLKWFSVPSKYKNVYVLGSFAQRVTLYSQQVRALNLVAALVKENVIHKGGPEVVVVGGGAAGLTAAAGALTQGARVTLLDELYGPMESQRNNRQRWIHPHIYDWPAPGSKDEEADLPVLGWSAGYAEQVANQIERQWDHLCLRFSKTIKVKMGVQGVKITRSGKRTSIKWKWKETDGKWKSETLKSAIIILAVGFGLEPKTQYQDSYWTEDDIDGGFRRSARKKKWLVSGFGDGALTDLMRLCITHFRHGNIVDVFRTESGIVEVEEQLKRLSPSLNESPALLTEMFRNLRLESLVEGLKDMKREGVEVFLVGLDPFLYGPKASVLNRLIVRVLEQMGAFELLEGPTKKIIDLGKGHLVKVGKSQAGKREWEYFDRIIRRHGPKPHALKASFPSIWKVCAGQRTRWHKQLLGDQTQRPQWQDWTVDFVVPKQTATLTPTEVAFNKAVKRFGIQVSKLVVSKELRNDGSSTMAYEVRGLSVLPGQRLSGIRLSFASTFGQYGRPELDQAAANAGLKWKDAKPRKIPSTGNPHEDAIKALQERLRRAEGTVLFPKALTGASKPVSFTLSVRTLNADALSKWEFQQLYSAKERSHVDGKGLENATEYMARLVWFPVDTLKLRVTLPRRTPGPVHASVFKLKGNLVIPVKEVIDHRILQNYPASNSWKISSSRWKKSAADDSVQMRQLNSSGQTWELLASKPAIGSYYSLDWPLPEIIGMEASQRNEIEAAKFRKQLLRYRAARMKGRTGGAIGDLFKKLQETIYRQYKTRDSTENFVISVLTYDDGDRHLKVVDAAQSGNYGRKDIWRFWLPFGQGLSGACFKQQGSFPLIYFEQSDQGEPRVGPEVYLRLPNLNHTVLLAIPLDHPDYNKAAASSSFETARQRIAVIDIGSNSKESKLFQLGGRQREQKMKQLISWCQEFCREMVAILRTGTWEK